MRSFKTTVYCKESLQKTAAVTGLFLADSLVAYGH